MMMEIKTKTHFLKNDFIVKMMSRKTDLFFWKTQFFSKKNQGKRKKINTIQKQIFSFLFQNLEGL